MRRVLPFPQASAAAWRASAWQLSSQSLNRAPEAGTDTDPGHWNCASGTELAHWMARGNCCGVRSSVLQRALPSHLLGQCRALREAEGELMAARTWARTGACGLSPVFPAGLGTGSTRDGCGQGPRSRTRTRGTRGSFSRLGAGLLEPHLPPPAEQQGCSQRTSQTGGGPESCPRTAPIPPS